MGSVHIQSSLFKLCSSAKSDAFLKLLGKIFRNSDKRSWSYGHHGGNCHRIGPSFFPSNKTPEAKKFANGWRMSLSFFMWVRYFGPFTAKTKSSGVWSYHV